MRARKSVNLRGRLATRSITDTSVIVLAGSVNVGFRRHFTNGAVIHIGVDSTMGHTSTVVDGVRTRLTRATWILLPLTETNSLSREDSS